MKSLNLHNIKLLNHVSFLKTDFFVANYKSLNITCSSLWHTSYSNPGSRSYISNYRSITFVNSLCALVNPEYYQAYKIE